MSGEGSDDDVDAAEELMAVTGRALAEHGIAELTTQRVADEWGKSQSLVHYYYETKEDLVVAYIEYLRERTVRNYDARADDPPLDRVRWLLLRHFTGPHLLEEPAFSVGLIELQAAAPYNDRIRDALVGLDDEAEAFLEGAIRDGIESGEFADVDVDAVVSHLLAWISGTILRATTLGRTDEIEQHREGIEAYIESTLLAD